MLKMKLMEKALALTRAHAKANAHVHTWQKGAMLRWLRTNYEARVGWPRFGKRVPR